MKTRTGRRRMRVDIEQRKWTWTWTWARDMAKLVNLNTSFIQPQRSQRTFSRAKLNRERQRIPVSLCSEKILKHT